MATNSLEVTLSTVTPIWTGGVDGTCDRLHITGIMGSLRWWYEVIVRGLGGWACDPSKHSCQYDPNKPSSGLCDVCKVFGATGWARRFRLIINSEAQLKPDHLYDRRPIASQRHTNHFGRTVIPTWYLNGPPLSGHVDIQIIATDKQFPIEVIGNLLQFLADWASIGAKAQMGLGAINIAPPQKTQYLTTYLVDHLTPVPQDDISPSLRDMFFVGMSAERFPPNETFNLKYDLRRLFHSNRSLRHFVMGTVENERQGTKVMITNPYNNNTSLRVWGWIPEEVNKFGTSREQVIKLIHSYLITHHKVNYWREFNSTRDTTGIQYTNAQEFLESLLKGAN
jgi:CRISPR-associated protein Cmr1